MDRGRRVTPWELALKDPHLMRLGDWLAAQMGDTEVARVELEMDLEWDGYGRETIRRRLEGNYESDMKNQCHWHSDTGDQCHWKCHWDDKPQIQKIVDPDYYSRPFVVLWTGKNQSHRSCPLFSDNKNEVNKKYIRGLVYNEAYCPDH